MRASLEVHLRQLGVGPENEPLGLEEPPDARGQGGGTTGRLGAVVPDHDSLRGPRFIATAQHEHGAEGVVDDALRDAAQDEALYGPAPTAAYHYEVRPYLSGEVEHLVDCGTLPEVRARDVGAVLAEQRHLRLEQLPRLRQETGPDECVKARRGHGLPGVRHVQLCVRPYREVDRGSGREGGVVRTVGRQQDSLR